MSRPFGGSLDRHLVRLVLGAALACGAAARGEVIFSEIMYNPAGSNEWEYLELYNRGETDIDLTGFTTERSTQVGLIPGGTLPAGGLAVLIRADSAGGRTLEGFQENWGSDINFVPMSQWASLPNSGSPTVRLLDAGGALVVEMRYGTSDPWPDALPTTPGGPSLAILDPSAADWSAPSNWALSEEGVNGAFRGALRPDDVGSPGFIPEPPAALLPGDANRDGRVDGEDFLIWQASFGIQEGAAWDDGDFNGDGRVDGEDFLIWQAHFGTVAESSAVTPEPGAMVAILMSGSLLLRRHRRGG